MAYIENLEEIKEISKTLDAKSVLEWIQPEKKITTSGNHLRSCCPAHGGDGKENFSINTNTHAWKCHSKGCTGTNLIDLYAQNRGYSKDQFHQAAEEFAHQFSLPIKYKNKENSVAINKITTKQNKTKKIHESIKQKFSEKKSYTKETVIQCWNEAEKEGKDTYFYKKALYPPSIARFGKNANGYQSTQIDYRDVDENLKYILCLGDRKFHYKIEEDTSGAFAKLGELNPNREFYVGEGIATAQTAWESTNREIPAISCGSWSNINPVIKSITDKFPSIKPIVLIDCDEGENGLKAAREIAKEFPQATFRKPNFNNIPNPKNHPQKELKDFNDMISKCEGTLEDVKQQLSIEFDISSWEEHKKKEQRPQEIETVVKSDSKSKNRSEHAGQVLKDINFLSKLKERVFEYKQNPDDIKLFGYPTNFKKLDEMIDGLQGGHLIILAGRTGMGKTYAALNMLKNTAIEQKIPSALYSLEMTNAEVFYRLISLMTKIPSKQIKRGRINDDQLSQVERSIKRIEESPLFVSDDPANSVLKNLHEDMKGTIRDGAKIVFVDHIGLVNCGSGYKENRATELGAISMSFKLLAKEYSIPVISLAQLNRDADSKDTPKLSHLRDSGELEQNADIVLFVHRRDYFDPIDKEGQVDIIVGKNRHGDVGTVAFSYNKPLWILEECLLINEMNSNSYKTSDPKFVCKLT